MKYTSIFSFFPTPLFTACIYSWIHTHPFLNTRYLKIWPWKSKIKVMGGVKGQGHLVCPTTQSAYWIISFSFLHVNPTTHSWNTAISKVGFENPRAGSWVRSRSFSGSDLRSIHIHLVPCQPDRSLLRYGLTSKSSQNMIIYEFMK